MHTTSTGLLPNILIHYKFQDERYSKYIGQMAFVPMTFGRHVPILSDKVGTYQSVNVVDTY